MVIHLSTRKFWHVRRKKAETEAERGKNPIDYELHEYKLYKYEMRRAGGRAVARSVARAYVNK